MPRGRKRSEYFMGIYLIGVYDDNNGDEIIGIFSNAYEYASFFGIKVETARVNLLSYLSGGIKHLCYKNKILTVYFIRIDEDI